MGLIRFCKVWKSTTFWVTEDQHFGESIGKRSRIAQKAKRPTLFVSYTASSLIFDRNLFGERVSVLNRSSCSSDGHHWKFQWPSWTINELIYPQYWEYCFCILFTTHKNELFLPVLWPAVLISFKFLTVITSTNRFVAYVSCWRSL